MIDLETHRVTYLINSRELNDVKEWLKTYKNLQLVLRDGSIVYKKAITLSHPLAIQVSDRFHILKNLTDYCKEYLKNKFDNNVVIEEKVVINKENKFKNLTLEKKLKEAKELKKEEIHHHKYYDSKMDSRAIFEYIESWYNRKRIHSLIGYMTPHAVYQAALGKA